MKNFLVKNKISTPPVSEVRTHGRSDKKNRPYRENVVGFILNRRNDVLIMKRAKATWHWQLPQGGVEPNETKRQAVLREMREETGLKGLRIIGVVENFHAYDWPRAPLYARDEYRGQRQTLFFLRYVEKGLRVSLDPKEATGARWVPIEDLLKWLAPVRHVMAEKALQSYQELFNLKKGLSSDENQRIVTLSNALEHELMEKIGEKQIPSIKKQLADIQRKKFLSK